MSRKLRKEKFIKPRFQLRILAQFFSIAVVMCIILAVMLDQTVMDVVRTLPNDEPVRLQQWPTIVLANTITTLAYMTPLMVGIGILVTFKIAGPAHRIEQYVKQLCAGEDPCPCMLRKGDESRAARYEAPRGRGQRQS